jgi:hypothetical protein
MNTSYRDRKLELRYKLQDTGTHEDHLKGKISGSYGACYEDNLFLERRALWSGRNCPKFQIPLLPPSLG